ncbi:MAG: DoxX family protein [Bacteroidota bacterium]
MATKTFKAFQVLLGLFMIIIGLNKFLVFIEIPNPPGDGGALMQIYITSGFLKLIGVLEMLGGIALLINRFVPLALTFITAIMFNATVFHTLHDPYGIGPALFCLLLSLTLVYANKKHFSELLGSNRII